MNANTIIRSASVDTDLLDIVRLIAPYETYPVTPELVRSWFEYNPPGRIQVRLVSVDENNAVTGYSVIVHDASVPAGHFFAWLVVDPALRCRGTGEALWQASLEILNQHGATRISSEVLDHDPAALAFAERRGFKVDRQTFHSFLDLDTFDETPFLPVIASLENQGIRFCCLADFAKNEDTLKKYYDLNLAVVRDIPGEDWDFDTYPIFFQDRILNAPWFKPEGQLLALDGDQWIGFASVSLQPEKKRAYNATTGVVRAYRGRNIALALKVLAARYARQHGARQIDTDNDSLNVPMLAVNRRLGYQQQPGKYLLVRLHKQEA